MKLTVTKRTYKQLTFDARMSVTAKDLTEILGEGWAIARRTPNNLERYQNCISRKEYEAAVLKAYSIRLEGAR